MSKKSEELKQSGSPLQASDVAARAQRQRGLGNPNANTVALFKQSSATNEDIVQIGNTPTFAIGPAKVTAKGLSIPNGITKQQYDHIGKTLFSIEGSVQWMLGDWLRYNTEWGDIPTIAKTYRRSASSLRNSKSVAEKFSNLSRRRDKLTFAHHQEVSYNMSDADRDKYLDAAEREGLSAKALRELIRADRLDDGISEDASRIDVSAVAKKVRNLAKLLNDDRRLQQNTRDQYLADVREMRELLEDIENKLHE